MTDPRGMTPDSLGGSKSFDPRVVMGQLPGSAPGLPSDTTRRTGDTTAVAQDTTQVVRPRGPSIGERLSSVISPLKRALLVLDPIVLGFDNTESHQQGGTVGQAAWAYQLGFTQNPGLDTVAGVSSIETKRSDHNLTGRSGIRFTQDIRSTFNYSFRTGESRSGTQAPNGTVEQTMFWIGGKGQPKRYPFVDVSMDWSGLEKFPFLSRVAQSVSLSSALSNKVSEQWTNSRGDVRQREHIRQWNPFLGVNFTWKGNVDTQLRYGRSNRFTDNIVALTYSRTSEQTISGTVSYTIRTGFRIPVLWLSSLKLQNQTTFSLNTDYRATVAEQAQDRVHYVKQSGSQTAWSISPRMTYSFSNTVQGQGSVSMQRIKDTVTNSKSSTFEFGIQVNIAIRG